MTLGLSKDIWSFRTTLFSMFTNHQFRHQATTKMGCQLMIADDHCVRDMCGYEWVNIFTLSLFNHQEEKTHLFQGMQHKVLTFGLTLYFFQHER